MAKPKENKPQTQPGMTEDEILAQGLSAIASGDYWGRTDGIVARGETPSCCGEPMVAEDDHGRFFCFTCRRRVVL